MRDLSHNREYLTYVLYNIWQIVILVLTEKTESSLFVEAILLVITVFEFSDTPYASRKEGLSVNLIEFTLIYQSIQYIRQWTKLVHLCLFPMYKSNGSKTKYLLRAFVHTT